MSCSTCHTVFPSLTTFGRQFKMRGYTMSSGQLEKKDFPYNLPLAMGVQVGNTSIKDPNKGADPGDFDRADKTIVQQLALYYGGRVAGKVGAFAQYNWDGIEKKWGAEMVDIRYADTAMVKDKELIWGVTMTNSPALQDPWNTNPMWSFPHLGNAGIMPMVTPLMDMKLANQVGGIGLYGFYDGQFYAEAGFYHNGHRGIFRPLNWGDELETAVKGNAPHLRLAWEKDWGSSSFEIGMHALRADVYPDADNPTGPTDRFTDLMLDSQYEHSSGAHMYSLHGYYIDEKRDWEASFPAGAASNSSDKLKLLNLSAHYWYQRKIGGGIGYFDYTGDTDAGMYAMPAASAMGNASGGPDARGWIIEGDYLPLKGRQNLRLGLRYTAFSKFNGASDNYNGAGRNASDNNSVFAYIWMLY